MQAAWQGYFALCPDYGITISKVLSDADMVMATGEAGGAIDRTAWQTPAAWHATVRDNPVESVALPASTGFEAGLRDNGSQ